LQAAAEDPPERAARVEQLRAEYARGEYDDDPAATVLEDEAPIVAQGVEVVERAIRDRRQLRRFRA